MNPNKITNVSFAASPALQAILNNTGASGNPVTPVSASKPITTESYLVQNPVTQQGVQSAALEKTPKTDIYEPIHKNNNNNSEGKSHNKAKVAGGIAAVGALVLLIIFSPTLAKRFLKNIDGSQELARGKEFFKGENLKVAAKKFTNFIQKHEENIKTFVKNVFGEEGPVKRGIQQLKDGVSEGGAIREGARQKAQQIKDAFGEDGVVKKGIQTAKDAVSEGGVVREGVKKGIQKTKDAFKEDGVVRKGIQKTKDAFKEDGAVRRGIQTAKDAVSEGGTVREGVKKGIAQVKDAIKGDVAVEKGAQQAQDAAAKNSVIKKGIQTAKDAISEGGVVREGIKKGIGQVKDAFGQDGVIGKRLASLFKKETIQQGAQTVKQAAEAVGEAAASV